MRRFLWVVIAAIMLLGASLFVETFALFESSGEGLASLSIGKWNINLNNLDVTEVNELTLNDLVYEENDNVEGTYFAPGSRASYEIVIDPLDTDVAIRYDISIDLSGLENNPNITFEVTEVSSGTITNNGLTYSGVISLQAIQEEEVVSMKMSIVWIDDENYDEADTLLMERLSALKIPISIKFTQYLGEVL